MATRGELPVGLRVDPSLLAGAVLRVAPEAEGGEDEAVHAATPLPRLLSQLFSQGRTGTLRLHRGAGEEHVIRLERGVPVRVRSSLSGKPLSEVLADMGVMNAADLAAAEERAKRNRVLLTVQLEREGVLDEDTMRRVQAEQFLLKLRALAALPDDVCYAFFDALENASDDPPPCDPLAAILATARVCGCRDQVDALLATLGRKRLRLHWAAIPARFALNEVEREVLTRLREQPLSYPELLESSDEGDGVVRPLVYALLVTSHLDRGDGSWPLGVEQGERPPRPSTHYQALGLSDQATPAEIERAFGDQTKSLDQKTAGWFEAFAHRVVARLVLCDPLARSTYDRALETPPEEQEDELTRALAALEHFRRAEQLVSEGDYAAAERFALRALEGAPEPDHLALLGRILGMRPDASTDLAIQILDAAVSYAPSSAQTLVHRASVLLRAGRDQEAAKDFRLALEIEPSNLDALRALRASEVSPPPRSLRQAPPVPSRAVAAEKAEVPVDRVRRRMLMIIAAGALLATLVLAVFTFHRSDEQVVRECLVKAALASYAEDLPSPKKEEVMVAASESRERLLSMGSKGAMLVANLLEDASTASAEGMHTGKATRLVAQAWLVSYASHRGIEPPPSAREVERALEEGVEVQPAQWAIVKADWLQWIARNR